MPDTPIAAWIDAGWFAIKHFIDPLDVSMTDPDSANVYPLNSNELFTSFLDGSKGYLISYFSRHRWLQHCLKNATYHYRSNHNAPVRTGYGRGKQWRQLLETTSLNHEQLHLLDLDQPVSKSNNNQVLLGLDIDDHSHAGDAHLLLQVIQAAFPGVYHEMSPNGIHVYLKVRFPSDNRYHHLQRLNKLATHLVTFFNNKRHEYNITAKVDDIKGLPSQFHFCGKTKAVSFKRSSCLALPRFGSFEQVLQFHQSPYFTLQDIQALIMQDLFDFDNQPEPPAIKKAYKSYDCLLKKISPDVESNALTRKSIFMRFWSIRQQKAPDINNLESIIQEYNEQDLNTGNITVAGRRTWQKLIKSFDVQKLRCFKTFYKMNREQAEKDVSSYLLLTQKHDSNSSSCTTTTSSQMNSISNIVSPISGKWKYHKGKQACYFMIDDVVAAYLLCLFLMDSSKRVRLGRKTLAQYLPMVNISCKCKQKGSALLALLKKMDLLKQTGWGVPGRLCTEYKVRDLR